MAGLTPVRLGLFSPSLPHLVAIREGYCLDPAHHADCTDLVVSEWQVNPDVAARMVAAAADARTGVVPDAVITPAQLEVVLASLS